MDKAAIEEIVMEILRRQDAGKHGMETEDMAQEKPEDKPAPVDPMIGTENSVSESMDASMIALIADTMLAFRGQ